MADREDQSNLPSIPDGGLSESMPDWLRRPPAWRTLPDREVVAPEPEATAALPEADTSVIDPRTFLSDDDLPAWLRNLGRGETAPSAGEPDDAAAETVDPPPAPGERSPAPAVGRFVPTSPPVPELAPSRAARETAPRPSTRSRPAPAPAWQGAWVVAILAAALIVALVVIVLLVL